MTSPESMHIQSLSSEFPTAQSLASLPPNKKSVKRNLAGTVQHWEALKHIIIELYQAHELELKEVRTIILNRYGFDATEQSYKRRLRAWDVRKNYSLLQKLAVLDQCSTAASDPPELNGKRLQVNRLRRPVQKKGRRLKLVSHPYHEDHAHNARFLSLVQLHPPHEDHATAHILYSAKSYYQQYFVHGSIESVGVHHWSLCEVFNLLRSALGKLSTKPPWAFKILNQVCASAENTLRSQPHQVIVLFGAYLSQRQWAQHLEIRSAILSFYKQMAINVLGPSHAIPNMLSMMEDTHISERVCRSFLHLAADVARAHLLQCTSDFIEYLVDLKALSFETCENVDISLDFLIPKASPSPESSFREHVRVMYALGYLRYWENRLPESKYFLFSVLKLVETRAVDFWRHQRGAAFLMGRVLDKESNLLESARYYRLGIEFSVKPHAADADRYDDIKLLEFLDHLEKFYIRHGNAIDAWRLRNEFGFLWAADMGK